MCPPVTQGGPLVSSDGSPHRPPTLAPCQSPSGALTGCATKRAVFDSASRPIPSSLCPSRRSVGKSGPEPPSSGSFCFVGRQQAACDQRQLRRFVLGQMLQRSLAVALPDLRKIRQQLFGYSLTCCRRPSSPCRSYAERLANFVSDRIDIAIRCGGGKYPGLSAERLMNEDHFPVCSPKLLKGPHPLRTAADLARHTLLHDVFTVDWAVWPLKSSTAAKSP